MQTRPRAKLASVVVGLQRSKGRFLVLVVPLDSNPYQESLYEPMRTAHPDRLRLVFWRRRPWVGVLHFFPLAAWCSLKGPRIAHVHWLAWDLRLPVPGRARVSGWLCRLGIWWLRVLRFRIIWTVHNVVPHEPQTDDDLAIVRQLARSSAALIVHSSSVLKALVANGVPADNAVVIPQGSYIGLYGVSPTWQDARRTLGLPPVGRTVLFFGLIRPYKGIPDLLTAWSGGSFDGTLVIAGSCPDPNLRAEIEARTKDDPSIHIHLGFILEAEVATYFSACDCTCFPFRDITTSSSALLALSFGKPLIAPRLGSLEDIPDAVGYFYDGEADHGLTGALEKFFSTGSAELQHRSQLGLAYAATLGWPAIAEKTFELYAMIVG